MVDMFMDEYDEAKIGELFRRDGYREGRESGLQEGHEKGLHEGCLKTLAGLVREGMLEISIASERAGISVDQMREAVEALA